MTLYVDPDNQIRLFFLAAVALAVLAGWAMGQDSYRNDPPGETVTVFKELFFEAVQERLQDEYGHDFIAEILEVEETNYFGATHLQVYYRGTNGQFSSVLVEESMGELVGALL